MVYCEAKRILTAYENKEGSIQSLINKSLCPHKNSLTCLIMRTLNCQKLLQKIIKRSKMLERENFLGEKLAELLSYDVLFGQGVRGKFKGTMKRNFASLTDALQHYMDKHKVEKREDLIKVFEDMNESTRIHKPKYIFLNTLKVQNKRELIEVLKLEFVRIKLENKEDFKSVITQIKNNEYLKDEHIKNMLIFSPDSLLNKTHCLFVEGHLLQIDKSSCLVPFALAPPADSHVVDAAAAPGNKTILLANLMKNTGLIHAFDIDEPRIKMMGENLKKHHVKNVRLKCADFLQTDIEKYEKVTHILVDPSCSGSGMTNRLKFGGNNEQELVKDKKRLWNLEALQRRFVLHAMSFPNVQRIVYSTCSIHEEENENVVRYVLENNKEFRLVNILENKWNNGRGIVKNDYDRDVLHLDYCIRTSYEANFTNGFFVSCFERVFVDEEVENVEEMESKEETVVEMI